MEQLIPIVAKLQDVFGAVGGEEHHVVGFGGGGGGNGNGILSAAGSSSPSNRFLSSPNHRYNQHSRNLLGQTTTTTTTSGGTTTTAGGVASSSSSYLDLPQIVVVGGQSSGKSSVLESLVGRSFLPRGSGIVTRRPLIVQLYNHHSQHNNNHNTSTTSAPPNSSTPTGSSVGKNDNSSTKEDDNDDEETFFDADDEWGEFLHQPNKKYYDFSKIRDEILRETERLTGPNKGISAKPLRLKIVSHRVLHELTLVDLPGVAKIAVGDQPKDIETQIYELCYHYISNPNAIILAVTAANTDLANSDAIKLARAVDPFGDRTVGVLTKLDLMDRGTDASSVLLNQVICLRRGYVGVVNRSQFDIDQNIPISDGLQKEDEFFCSHPVYSSDETLASKCGTTNLAKTLNSILMHHIKQCLPELRNRILRMIGDVEIELDALGSGSSSEDDPNLGASLLKLIGKFCTNYMNCIDGRMSTTSFSAAEVAGSGGACMMNELFGGARIAYIFKDVFSQSLMGLHPLYDLSDDDIRTTIANTNGTRASLFVPELSFDILVRRQISRLEQPGLQCVDLVLKELHKIAVQCEPMEFQRYPQLRQECIGVFERVLKNAVTPTRTMVSNLIQMEMSFINTSHPDFIGGSRAIAQLTERMKQQQDAQQHPHHPSRGGGGGAGDAVSTRTSSSQNLNGGFVTVPTTAAVAAAASASAATETGPIVGETVPIGASSPTAGLEVGPVPSHQGSRQGEHNSNIMDYIFGRNQNSTNTSGNHHPYESFTPSRSIFSTTRGGAAAGGNMNAGNGFPSIVQLPQVPETMRPSGGGEYPFAATGTGTITERERVETEIIKSLIESYFVIVRKNFIDMVPKSIMHFLVNESRDVLQNELVSSLYQQALIPDLMKEAEDTSQRRQTCLEMRDLLRKALEIVNEVRDYDVFS